MRLAPREGNIDNRAQHSSVWRIVEISEKREGDIVVLMPVGHIDNETSAEFQTRLLEVVGEGKGRVLMDFTRVDYISSAGLRALMTASKRTKAGGGRIAVAALNAMVKEIYDISRFTLIVPAFATIAEASTELNK
jgi:anti-sigma B factor antagonist